MLLLGPFSDLLLVPGQSSPPPILELFLHDPQYLLFPYLCPYLFLLNLLFLLLGYLLLLSTIQLIELLHNYWQ